MAEHPEGQLTVAQIAQAFIAGQISGEQAYSDFVALLVQGGMAQDAAEEQAEDLLSTAITQKGGGLPAATAPTPQAPQTQGLGADPGKVPQPDVLGLAGQNPLQAQAQPQVQPPESPFANTIGDLLEEFSLNRQQNIFQAGLPGSQNPVIRGAQARQLGNAQNLFALGGFPGFTGGPQTAFQDFLGSGGAGLQGPALTDRLGDISGFFGGEGGLGNLGPEDAELAGYIRGLEPDPSQKFQLALVSLPFQNLRRTKGFGQGIQNLLAQEQNKFLRQNPAGNFLEYAMQNFGGLFGG